MRAAWQLDHDFLDAEAMADRFGQFRLGADEVAVFERDAGVVDPQGSGQGAPRAGACDRRRAPLFIAGSTGGTLVATASLSRVDGEVVTASHLVIAAGPWAGTLLGGAFPLTPVRTVTYHFEPVGDRAPFAPDRFPAFVWELAPGDALYGLADVGSGAPKVGFHHRHVATDPDHVDRHVDAEEVAAMRSVLAARIPALAGRCVASAVCLYTMTPDEHFVIGHLPGSDGRVSVAAGFSGHGFKFVPVIGEILADLAVDGATRGADRLVRSHSLQAVSAAGVSPSSVIDCSRITNF